MHCVSAHSGLAYESLDRAIDQIVQGREKNLYTWADIFEINTFESDVLQNTFCRNYLTSFFFYALFGLTFTIACNYTAFLNINYTELLHTKI